jgi:hypothetical protein
MTEGQQTESNNSNDNAIEFGSSNKMIEVSKEVAGSGPASEETVIKQQWKVSLLNDQTPWTVEVSRDSRDHTPNPKILT